MNYKIDKFSVHELLDRTWMLNVMINDFLLKHPVTKKNMKIKKSILKASDALGDAYQQIANLKEYETTES